MEQNMSGGDVPESQTLYAKNSPKEQRWCQSRVPISLRPVRLIQLVRKMINYSYDNEILIIDIMLLSLTTFMWIRLGNPLGTMTSIVSSMMFVTFTIIMGIDTVGQISGFLTPDLPIFLVDLVGLILFMLAAQVVYYFFLYRRSRNDAILALIILCLIGALLFLLDAMIMIMYWRYTYLKSKCLPCVPGKSVTLLYRKPAYDEYSEETQSKFSKSYDPITCDVSTCVSRNNTRSCASGNFGTRSSSNRIGVGPRREYVDSPTDPESNVYVKSAETQTEDVESAKLTDHETLAIAAVEEKHAQTFQPCPVCSAALDYSPEGICPSVLAMIQSLRLFSSDSGQPANWKTPALVERGTSPKSNSISGLDATESTLVIAKKPPRVYETRPCPTHGAGLIAQKAGLPNPVTRTTLTHCIRKSKKCQTPLAKLIVVTDKCQNTEMEQTEKGTNVEGSEKVNATTQDERGSLNGQRGIEEANVQGEDIGLPGNLNVTKPEAPSTQGSSSSEVSRTAETIEESLDIVRNASREVMVKEHDAVVGSAASPRLSAAPTENASATGKVERGSKGSKRKSSVAPVPMNFFTPRSSDKVNIPQTKNAAASSTDQESQVPASSEIKKDPTHSETTSQRNIFQRNNKVKSIASTCTSSFERLSSTFAEVNRPLGNSICLPESNRQSSDSGETTNSALQCPCNYYKDVFGRYICRHCAHKHLIKIPQRCTAKPVGDIKCCSCSRAIFRQTPSVGKLKCKGCCKCRYAMYESSKK